MNEIDKVYFANGNEDGPWSPKMIRLSEVAAAKGFDVLHPDFADFPDPDERVQHLVSICAESEGATVLVGSRMGAYVSAAAASIIKPEGLFLLSPAFYLAGYEVPAATPVAGKIAVVHGWHDEIVPFDDPHRFANEIGAELHPLDSEFRLEDQLHKVEAVFSRFLDGIRFASAGGLLAA